MDLSIKKRTTTQFLPPPAYAEAAFANGNGLVATNYNGNGHTANGGSQASVPSVSNSNSSSNANSSTTTSSGNLVIRIINVLVKTRIHVGLFFISIKKNTLHFLFFFGLSKILKYNFENQAITFKTFQALIV